MWVSIIPQDLEGTLSGPEAAAFKTAALGDGQGDPLPGIIGQCVDEARGFIAAAHIALPPGDAIPLRLKRAVLCMVRYRLLTRLPIKSPDILEERRKEYDDALRLLSKVADKSFAIDPAEGATSLERPAKGAYGSSPRVIFHR